MGNGLQPPVCGNGQELLEFPEGCHLHEQFLGLGEAPCGDALRAQGFAKRGHLFSHQGDNQFAGYDATVVECGAMDDPLPDLRPADFRSGGILHQVVQRHRAATGKPGFDILDTDADIFPQPGFAARALVDLQQVVAGDLYIRKRLVGNLVGAGHQPVEDLQRHRHQRRMGHPGAVMAVVGFAFLVGAHFIESGFIGDRIALDRNLRRHATHGMGAAPVTGLDQQQAVGTQEGLVHNQLATVGQRKFGFCFQSLDEGKNVIPASTVQPDDAGA